jgi:hypothetical protein
MLLLEERLGRLGTQSEFKLGIRALPQGCINLETAVNAKTPRGKGAKGREMERGRQTQTS